MLSKVVPFRSLPAACPVLSSRELVFELCAAYAGHRSKVCAPCCLEALQHMLTELDVLGSFPELLPVRQRSCF
eukprot:SAG22_NODE_1233_length_5065_cov_12.050141_8_plen_73_part_00